MWKLIDKIPWKAIGVMFVAPTILIAWSVILAKAFIIPPPPMPIYAASIQAGAEQDIVESKKEVPIPENYKGPEELFRMKLEMFDRLEAEAVAAIRKRKQMYMESGEINPEHHLTGIDRVLGTEIYHKSLRINNKFLEGGE